MAYVVKNVRPKCWSGIFHYFEGRPNNLFLPCRPKRMPLQWVSKRSDPQQKSGLSVRSGVKIPAQSLRKINEISPWKFAWNSQANPKTLPHFVGNSVNFCVTAMDDWSEWFLFVNHLLLLSWVWMITDYFVLFPLSLQAVQISPFGLGTVSISWS